MGESIQALLATNENLEVLEDRSEALRSSTQTFQRTARAVRVVQQRKHRGLGRISWVLLCVLLAVAVAPLVIYYREDIFEFFDSMFPPCDRFTVLRPASCDNATEVASNATNATDVGSGEAGGERGSGEAGSGSAHPHGPALASAIATLANATLAAASNHSRSGSLPSR